MSTRIPTFSTLVQDFFIKHLAIVAAASTNTVASYRDAMKLFLQYASKVRACTPDELDTDVIDADLVRAFLDWLHAERGCAPRTRNQRLAALKSFARYVANVAPEHLERCRRIRELRPASVEHKEIRYLTEDEVVTLIAAVDVATPAGRRDRALLLLLYNTGARVQEVVDLNVGDVNDGAVAVVRLLGKGRKHRSCPLWARTLAALRQMLADRTNADESQPLFLAARGTRLSRSGITYVLRRAKDRSGITPARAERLSPHVIRHTTAMHLLESGVDITTIAAWLGHAQLATTHGYIEVNLRMKQAAIANESALPEICDGEYPSSTVISWLEGLARRSNYVERPSAKSSKGFGLRSSERITRWCG
jgi:integrase/recombinase XerD